MTKRWQLRYPFQTLVESWKWLIRLRCRRWRRDAFSGFCFKAKMSGLWSVNTVAGPPPRKYRKYFIVKYAANNSRWCNISDDHSSLLTITKEYVFPGTNVEIIYSADIRITRWFTWYLQVDTWSYRYHRPKCQWYSISDLGHLCAVRCITK